MRIVSAKDMVSAPGVDIMHGPEVVRGAWEAMATTISGSSWEPVMAKVSSSGDMAYVHGTASGVDADGNATAMKYLEVWVKIDDEWKVAADVQRQRPVAAYSGPADG